MCARAVTLLGSSSKNREVHFYLAMWRTGGHCVEKLGLGRISVLMRPTLALSGLFRAGFSLLAPVYLDA